MKSSFKNISHDDRMKNQHFFLLVNVIIKLDQVDKFVCIWVLCLMALTGNNGILGTNTCKTRNRKPKLQIEGGDKLIPVSTKRCLLPTYQPRSIHDNCCPSFGEAAYFTGSA